VAKNYHHGDLRRALVDASVELIAESGSGALTLREAARRAGVSHTAPYRHFRDKADLMAAVAGEGFAELRRRMEAAAGRARGAREKLRAMGRAYIEFAVEQTAHFRVMFGEPLNPSLYPLEAEEASRALAALVKTIDACQGAGDIPRGDPVAAARVAWSMVHGVASLATSGQFPGWSRRQLRQFAGEAMRVLMDGLSAPADGASGRSYGYSQ
jgi:AcrR family transcriptional regulator